MDHLKLFGDVAEFIPEFARESVMSHSIKTADDAATCLQLLRDMTLQPETYYRFSNLQAEVAYYAYAACCNAAAYEAENIRLAEVYAHQAFALMRGERPGATF